MKDSVPSYIEKIHAKPLLESYVNVRQYTFKHELFEGGLSEPITREIIEHKQAVAVLLHDPKKDALVLIEQVRFAAHLVGVSPGWSRSSPVLWSQTNNKRSPAAVSVWKKQAYHPISFSPCATGSPRPEFAPNTSSCGMGRSRHRQTTAFTV